MAWRSGLGVLQAVAIGYLYLWATLVVVNPSVAIAAWQTSIWIFIAQVTIGPIPGVIAAILGALIGNMLRTISLKRVSIG